MVIECGSPKAVAASSKETPCFRRFLAALRRSQRNSRAMTEIYVEAQALVQAGLATEAAAARPANGGVCRRCLTNRFKLRAGALAALALYCIYEADWVRTSAAGRLVSFKP